MLTPVDIAAIERTAKLADYYHMPKLATLLREILNDGDVRRVLAEHNLKNASVDPKRDEFIDGLLARIKSR